MPTVSHIPPSWVLLLSALVLFVLYQAAMWWIEAAMRLERRRREMFPALTTAEHLVELLGEDLIGRQVTTYDYGECKGGRFKVIKLKPDPNAPEIVFTIDHPDHGEIGVFDHENVYYEDTGVGL